MSEGLAAVQSRIAELQALLNPAPAARPGASSASGTAFDDVLAGLGGGGSGADLGEQVVDIAKQYLGVDYRWGGTDPDTGLDCSGLTQLVYSKVGVELPRVSRDQARAGTAVASLDDAKPGDLVFFGSPVHHVGIYLGDGQMLDAPRRGKKVQIRDVYETPSAIRRVLPDSASSASGADPASALSRLLGSSTSGAAGVPSASGTAGVTGPGGVSGPYGGLFASAGRRYGVDPALLSAVAKAESSYRPGAVSGAGARGLMQLMPGTARDLGVDPMVPAQAVDGAARLLSQHLRSFNGRVDLALAAYNAGPGAVRKHGGVPPYAETQQYVQRVTRYWGELR